METPAQVPSQLGPDTSNAPAMPQPQRIQDTAATKVSEETPKDIAQDDKDSGKKTPLDKATAVTKTIAKDVQEGLSYANARRARETYNPTPVQQ